jgi:ribonuclease D
MFVQAGEKPMGMTYEIQSDLSNQDVERISKTKIVAVDCEMAGLNPHRDPLYLVQLCDMDNTVNIVRTTMWPQAENLKSILCDGRLIKVFHFAIMDCAFLNKYLSIVVENAYCTKIASKLARTYSNSHSLNTLLEDLLGLTKDNKSQMSYWGRQNLSNEQVQYALTDVKHLLKIKNELEIVLAEKGTLPTGITYTELNRQCQQFVPALTHLWLNGWDFGKEDSISIFGR